MDEIFGPVINHKYVHKSQFFSVPSMIETIFGPIFLLRKRENFCQISLKKIFFFSMEEIQNNSDVPLFFYKKLKEN